MRGLRVLSLVFCVFIFFFHDLSWAHADCMAQGGESVRLVSLARDGTVRLADGRSLRLSGIEAPPDEMRFNAAARQIALLKDQTIHLRLASTPRDRYGRLLAQAFGADGHLIAGDLVAAGLVRVAPRADMRDCIGDLYAAEASARAAGRGLWADPAFAIIAAGALDTLHAREGTFQIVEGVVTDAINKQGRLYINYGDDWRTDFTVTVAPADARLFQDVKAMLKPGQKSALIGQRLRVRGYLVTYNGPEMVLTCPEQIEMLMVGEAQKAKEARSDKGE